MANARPLDVICVGRAAVDLYGEQIGGRLEDMQSFARYLGGSPANTAVGAARLGLKPAMLTRVGDEHNGRFVRETLESEGVDVSHVQTDPQRLTALVFLGIRDRDTFPLLFYRERCADMAISAADIDAPFIASAQALLISGTHLSQPGPAEACRVAMALARSAGTRIVLDIDYRPVLWGLTAPGLGEQRYVPSMAVSERLQTVIGQCDLVVGTEEEIRIAGGCDDTLTSLKRLRALTGALLVMKRGPMGCVVFEGAIPDDIEQGLHGPGFPVEVFNVLGAGDAFMAGFLRGWLRDEPLARCCTYANASGALVVSRHGCAPAMPSWTELQHFLACGSRSLRLREDAALERLHRATTRTRHWKQLAVLAFDHRSQLESLADRHHADRERIAQFKALVAAGAHRGAEFAGLGGHDAPRPGVIVDERHGDAVLPRMTGIGWWVARPVETAGSRPLAFDAGPQLALHLRSWPAEQVAKCLLSHHPDDPEPLRQAQFEQLRRLQEACIGTGHEWLLELIPPPAATHHPGTLARALEQVLQAGLAPDWWKLPPPQSQDEWQRLEAVLHRHDPHCRGVLLLGQDADEDVLVHGFRLAATHAVCKGFAVGRSIFGAAAAGWFAGEWSDDEVLVDVARRYAGLVDHWRRAHHPIAATAAQELTS
ncbi:MAG TPA: 5-dehydro-2-deoxygluconokinase [Albitalea sp.]|uniref:bifunctional 5-dehydro-2-deoxygluconokinase/5-dehydro-2- deoxyphosphogluconate aldolase n=1 Tax=Piscinibacter sp. TaxID=1903157 RepID=UPI002ED138DF